MPPSTPTDWVSAPRRPTLGQGGLDVWRVDLASAGSALMTVLAGEERARADRFAHATDGLRWATSRAILRALLGSYANVDPGALQFKAGPHGKPSLAGRPAPRFNVSHSGELALYAFCDGLEVGVDVELAGRTGDMLAVARRMFGEEAARRLTKLDPTSREREFLHTWVRHEATVKCRGTGIGRASEDPAVSNGALWIADLELGPAAAGAIAVAGEPSEVRLLQWQGIQQL